MNLEMIFSVLNDKRGDLEKAIRSVAFLTEFGSNAGNGTLDGTAACGLSQLLHLCAAEVSGLYTQDDIRKAGGDPRLVWEDLTAKGVRQ